ncbi:MAG: hypothetical protein ACOX0C_02725 [Patescibacteria group bacterium]
MVSPNLIKRKKVAEAVELTDSAKRLFQVIYSEQNKAEVTDDAPKIKVSNLVSRLAFIYEKVRNAVDYDEDHRLRKNAIARILRRQIMIEGVIKEASSEQLATHLLTELIRGSYLPNNQIPEAKIGEIETILEKYIYLRDQVSENLSPTLSFKADLATARDLINKKNKINNWLLVLAACEIEENLSPNKVKQVIVNNLFEVLSKNIELSTGLPYRQDLAIQIYLSIGRTYLKSDEDLLSFVLFKYYNAGWLEIGQESGLNEEEQGKINLVASQIIELNDQIKEQLKHPLRRQLDKITRVYSLYYTVLAETIENDPAKLYQDLQTGDQDFIANLRKTCQSKYKKAKSRLWRAAIRSIIYIFLTKSIFVVAIELPAVAWFGESVNALALAINISFPAVLLFFMVLLIRLPKDNNTDKIVKGIKEISFAGQARKTPIILRKPAKRNMVLSVFFGLLYFASFVFSVYLITRVLYLINFNWVSVIIFLFFLAFVSFFSIVVTKGVKDLIIIDRRENLLTFLVDLFYMPIIMAGKWLSNSFSKINIFIFIFDFILEAPFKILVEIADDWTKYVRERRDSMD